MRHQDSPVWWFVRWHELLKLQRQEQEKADVVGPEERTGKGKVADDFLDASSSLPSGDAALPSSSCAHGNSDEKVDIHEEEEEYRKVVVVEVNHRIEEVEEEA